MADIMAIESLLRDYTFKFIADNVDISVNTLKKYYYGGREIRKMNLEHAIKLTSLYYKLQDNDSI
jgi:hypothetical protein